MKNIETIQQSLAADREKWFSYRRTLTANLKTLVNLYHSFMKPYETVNAFVQSVGYENAVEIIASLVNRSSWDGRISRDSSEWAKSQDNSFDEESANRLELYTSDIHMAHLNQIAHAIMKYEPKTPDEETPDEETPDEEIENVHTLEAMTAMINARPARSAWARGVKVYSLELLENLTENLVYNPDALSNVNLLRKALLNGASDWNQYSEGGCSLCYDGDIAERLCTPSEIKRTHGGERNPNSRETWIDVQSRALYQAARHIVNAFREVKGVRV